MAKRVFISYRRSDEPLVAQLVYFILLEFLPPKTDISCFGVFVRESGQKRVPDPPAMMTTYMQNSYASKNNQTDKH